MTTDAEIWRVQLPTGELRAFSLDALDEAFEAGLIHGGTLVLAPGATSWALLSVVAGLDATEPVPTPSLSPVAISYDAPHVQSFPPPAPAPLDVADLADDALKPKKGRIAIAAGLGVCALAACAVVLAPKLGKTLGDVHPDRAAANAIQAPPPAVDVTGDDYKPKNELTAEQKRLLLEADKKKEEERKRREEAAAKARETKRPARKGGKSSGPFVNGGNKFDPLNGAL